MNTRLRRHVLVPLFTILFAAGLVSLSACDMMGITDLTGSSGDSGNARMQVLLVDNPFPFDLVDEVNVTISRVDLRSGENTVTIMDEVQTFNLLELQNGVSALLGDVELSPAQYTEARLIVENATILLLDGRSFDVKVPSGATSGVKVKLDDVLVQEGNDVTLTLDFDVSKSFVVQGNPNTPAGIKGFLMKPTIISKGMKNNGDGGDDADEDGDDGDEDGDDADDDGDDADDDGDEDGDDGDGADDDGDDADDDGDGADDDDDGDDADDGDEDGDDGDDSDEDGDETEDDQN